MALSYSLYSNDGLTVLYTGHTYGSSDYFAISESSVVQCSPKMGDNITIYTHINPSTIILGLSTSSGQTTPSYSYSDMPSIEQGGQNWYIVEQPVGVIYKHLLKDGNKIQVDSAIRDGNGVKIDTNYAKKSELSSFVDKTSNQTITSTKTFGNSTTQGSVVIKNGYLDMGGVAGSISQTTSQIRFTNGNTVYHSIKANQTGIIFSSSGNNYGFYSYGFTPTASNALDLGRSGSYGSGRWRNIYMCGNICKYDGDSTTQYTLTLPNKTGTVALKSDILTSLSSSDSSSTGSVKVLEDVTYTAAAASGTTSVTSLSSVGSGSFSAAASNTGEGELTRRTLTLTHTHTSPTAAEPVSVVTGVAGGSVSKTTKYIKLSN